MGKADFIKTLRIDKCLVEDINFNPYYQVIQSGPGGKIRVAGRSLISLGSNDYLGLANNGAVKEEAIRILKEYGVSMCGTPIVVGYSDFNHKLEKEIAAFVKQDAALVFPSCYQCNVGIFRILTTKEDVIISDKEIHSSLLNGIGLSEATFRFFPHNNMKILEELLKKHSNCRNKFVVLEGLYSTNGDVPPLDEVVKLAKSYEAFVIIDDAHGVGVLGQEGRGVLEVFNAFKGVDLITGSLGKAIGTFGGFLAGNEAIIDYFRYTSPMYFYSTALPPHIAAASIVSLGYIQKHPELRQHIQKLARKLHQSLGEMGFNLTNSTTPLVSVVFESSEDTFLATKMLAERGVYVVPFVPPSVPKNSPRIRMTLNANLKEEDIDLVIKAFNDIRKEKPQWVK